MEFLMMRIKEVADEIQQSTASTIRGSNRGAWPAGITFETGDGTVTIAVHEAYGIPAEILYGDLGQQNIRSGDGHEDAHQSPEEKVQGGKLSTVRPLYPRDYSTSKTAN